MSLFKRMRLTDAGVDLLRMVHEGQPLELLSIHVGNGMWSEEERTGTPPAALKTSKRAVAITEYEKQGGAVVLNGVLSNTGLTEGFMMTEMGVTARHPENGELLYMADFVPPELASYLPPASDAPVEMPLRVIVKAGTGAEVVVEIEDRFVSASKKDLDTELSAHKHAADPHPDMRVAAPSLKLPNGYVDRVNEGEAIGFKVTGVPENTLWETEVKLQILNAAKEDVTSDFAPQVTKESVTLTAPQVPADSVFSARFQTWQHGGLASLWSAPVEFTVVDVPVDAPAFTSPANHATGIGETPTLTITAGSSDDTTKHHEHTEFVISTDLLRTAVVVESGELGAVTSWKVPAEKLQTGSHLYLHARTKWGDTWSGWTTIDVFTTDLFQFIEAPTILAPQEGSEVMWTGLKAVIATPVIEEGGTLQQDKIEAEISKNGEVIHTETVNVGQKFVDLPTQERNTALTMRVRVHDAVRGWSAWSEVRAFRTKTVGNGARFDGGIAISHTFANGQQGYLIVAPASKRIQRQWGLRGTNTSLTDITSASIKDPRTGAQNTAILCSSPYNSMNDAYGSFGAPAAEYCDNLVFEGCNDFFLPNKDELARIIEQKAVIDAADETSGSKFNEIGTNSIWSSSEYRDASAWIQPPIDGGLVYGIRSNPNWVVPCRMFIP
ncbi:DUF1566 domain-containing protein [Halodesulfovibrio spirochaetisodalis]|uniref:DUF1566 domain-containing protein n=1 Tax=Halodesulfovibrio spirochaetisodalis TaxID=1560234 RepID=A0A1B7XDH3_9BACT|nr:DUF1566 domain-containing protein [Halodesulfovibrio spirochaetisodalis]OBQ52117.1 hypothetical protein SP90_08010 [Halodesulfovibrio spirochaetisodalis]